jgi:release factor glutamine methyltransferase
MKSTIKQWRNKASQALEAAGITSYAIDAELILAHALNQDRVYLISHPRKELSHEVIEKADQLLARRLENEPMAFILGVKEFYGLTLKTDARALIPRPESEILVEAALNWLEQHPHPQVAAEIGTGSGAITIALAKHAPQHHFIATDNSAAALDLARSNAENYDVDVTFLEGDLATPLIEADYVKKINLLTANLPYIPVGLLKLLDPDVKYFEPDLALNGGRDGLDIYRRFLPQAKELIAPDGFILFEHDYDQGQEMRNLAYPFFPGADINTLKDYLGHDRILSINLRNDQQPSLLT